MVPFTSLGIVAVGVVASCGQEGDEARVVEREIALEEVQRYGWEGARTNPELPSDAGVIGTTQAISHGPDGNLYVLDPSWNKIIVFSADAEVVRVLQLRVGDGPGEVRRARDLAWTAHGDLAVLDTQLSRVVLLSMSGEPAGSIQLDARVPVSMVITGDTIWISSSTIFRTNGPSLWAFDMTGALLGSGSGSAADEELWPSGFGLAMSPDGSLLQGRIGPGLWYRFRGYDAVAQGTEIVSGLTPPAPISGGSLTLAIPPAFTTDIGVLPDGTVLMSHLELGPPTGEGEPPTETSILSFFTPSGDFLDSIEIGVGETSWYASPHSGNVYVSQEAPFPMIVEYRIAGL